MVHDLEWPTLEQRRLHCRLTMLYKIYNRLVVVDTDFTSQLTLTQSSTTGHASRFLYNHSAAVLFTPTRSFLALFGTGSLERTGD